MVPPCQQHALEAAPARQPHDVTGVSLQEARARVDLWPLRDHDVGQVLLKLVRYPLERGGQLRQGHEDRADAVARRDHAHLDASCVPS